MYLHTSPKPWVRPTTPLLMTRATACADDVPTVDIPETAQDVELVIRNRLSELHVVHLHGMRFRVMAVEEAEPTLALRFLTDAPAARGVLKDTVAVPPMGAVTIRLIADNPGVWALRAMSVTAHLRGAVTAFNVLPSKQQSVPRGVPTQGPCAPSDVFV